MTNVRVPPELEEKLTKFDAALTNAENILKPLVETNEKELSEKLESIDNAKLEVFGAYTINSLFWMYLNVCGVNPKDHSVKQELSRIQSYMKRVKEIPDKNDAKKPRLDKPASKRFVRSALWQQAKKKNPATPSKDNDD
ncbi:hypothetical protein FSP39_016732 [Pinctada imbricata]|uniref:Nuclear nucleic acid-binding protein C1D n=1 Tax=Pinctada imbricata TaxID=66713 RepID=A0AA88YE20_PINIB|nr:hypothetical protein FSP39_016732 [Pinctada imbricata]